MSREELSSTTKETFDCSKSLRSRVITLRISSRFESSRSSVSFLSLSFENLFVYRMSNWWMIGTLDTNNLWVNLRAIKRIMENDGMDLEVIVNQYVSSLLPYSSSMWAKVDLDSRQQQAKRQGRGCHPARNRCRSCYQAYVYLFAKLGFKTLETHILFSPLFRLQECSRYQRSP